MTPAGEQSPPWVVSSLTKVCQFFDVSDTTIRRWRARGMPERSEFGWDLAAITCWRYGRADDADPGNGESETLRSAARRRMVSEADRSELTVAKEKAQLVELSPISRVTVRHIHESKAVLERIPDEIVAALPVKTRARVKRAVRKEAFELIDAACQILADTIREPEFLGKLRPTDADRLALIAAATGGLNAAERLSLLDRARKQAKQTEPAA